MVPVQPKIYHIVHCDRLPSILRSGGLLCDATMHSLTAQGTTIGMASIKRRRLEELVLECHPKLHVGECVPFYFCPRSIMLFLIYRANHPELTYRGGQEPIVHLEADLHEAVAWATEQDRRWAFTLSNAGAYYFEDRANLDRLEDLDWAAIATRQWSGNGVDPFVKERKQAEFLMERDFPWHLVRRIGVRSGATYNRVVNLIAGHEHRPVVEIKTDWYY